MGVGPDLVTFHLQKYMFGSRPFRQFSVSVYALEESLLVPKKIQWVRKDSRSLVDRVLFLGSPISFAVDASLLGGDGGCAYFASTRAEEQSGVFRYSLIDSETKLVEQLPLGWHNQKCTWLVPPAHQATTSGRSSEGPSGIPGQVESSSRVHVILQDAIT